MERLHANGLRALANERRLAIMSALGRGEHAVGELGRRIGLAQSAVSQHLARLRGAGLVSRRRQGQTIYYRTDTRGLAAVIAGLNRLLRE